MALTRPLINNLNTNVEVFADPLIVLHGGSASANVDVGFLMNRANGLVSNVAIYWNETGNTFVTAFTSNTGITDTNIAVTSYAPITTGHHLPGANVTYDLGSPTQRFRSLYLSGNTIDLAGAVIKADGVTGAIALIPQATTYNPNPSGIVISTSGTVSTIKTVAGIVTAANIGDVANTAVVSSTSTFTNANVTGNLYVGNLDVAGTTIFRNTEVVTTTEYVATINATNLYASTIGNTGATLTGTLNTAAQPNITSVGPLTSLAVSSGGITSVGSIVTGTLNAGTIGNVGAAVIGATGRFDTSITTATLNAATIGNIGATLTGTLQTASQPNVTTLAGVTSIGASSSTSVTGTLQTASQPNITTLSGVTSIGATSSTAVTGTLQTASQPNITTLAGLTTFGSAGSTTIAAGNLTISGNLSVSGQSVSIGSTSLSVQDPIINLNTPTDLTPLTSPTTADIGVKFHYYDSADSAAFIGRTYDTGYLEWYGRGNDIGNVFTGTIYGTIKTGAYIAVNTTPATSTTTGALQVAGGAGIQGAVWVGGLLNIAGTTTLGSALTYGGVTLNNSVTGTGSMVLSASPTLTGTLTAASANFSSTATFGGSTNHASGITASTVQAGTIGNTGATLTGTLSTASQPNITTLAGVTSIGASSSTAVTGTLQTASQPNITTLAGVTSIGASSSTALTGTIQTASQPNITSVGSLSTLTVTGVSTYNGNMIAASGTSSTSATTGALVVAGGVGVSGNIVVGALYTTNGLFWAGNNNIISTGGGGGGGVAGNSGQIQYNSGGVAGATSLYYFSANTTIAAIGGIASTSTTSGQFQVAGGMGVTGNIVAGGVLTNNYYYANGAPISSTFGLSGTSGTGSVTVGTNVLTFAGTNGFTASVSGSTVTLSDPQNLQTSASPTFAGGSFTGNVTRNSKPLVTNYTGSTAPSNPQQGDTWYNSSTDTIYQYIFDGTNNVWVDTVGLAINGNTNIAGSTLSISGTAATGSLAITGSLTVSTSATVTGTLTTGGLSVSTLTGFTATGSIIPGSTATYNLGSATNTWATIYGKSTSAAYADLAEIYSADTEYLPGTVLVFGGTAEVTTTTESHDPRVAGVISTDPAHLMNAEAEGVAVALTGRVPCFVRGPVRKGDRLVTSDIPGVAEVLNKDRFEVGCVIGKSLCDYGNSDITTIEIAVGRY